MRITSKNFWNAVLTKLVETAISVKIWILATMVYFVYRLYGVADELRAFMMSPIMSDIKKIQIISSLQGKVYDIATSLLISGVVVIVLSRVTFQHAKLKNGYHKGDLSLAQREEVDSIKNEFA